MTDANDRLNREKDRLLGGAKEIFGKATGDQETELKGKMQKKKAEAGDKISDAKNSVLGKINDAIDGHDQA